ncbi:MAG TPA: hypothetical protein VHL11_08935, partial [Phototrophicaceae bacterium]|nr:hypothetical protein [Phototrophicaceae bacterium]
RLKDATVGQRRPPSECGSLYGLILVGSEALFWLNTAEFTVQIKKEVLATCKTDSDQCAVYIPQS